MLEPKFSESSDDDSIKKAILLVKSHYRTRRIGESSWADELGLYDDFYRPDNALNKRVEDYKRWYDAKVELKEAKKTKNHDKIRAAKKAFESLGENAGELLEEIAFLAFQCLSGCEDLDSYRTVNAQLDIVATINKLELVYDFLNLNGEKIIIECKNIDEAVDVKDFSRLCYIVQHNFPEQCYLGIFLLEQVLLVFHKKVKHLKEF